jgi:hypothetical protein
MMGLRRGETEGGPVIIAAVARMMEADDGSFADQFPSIRHSAPALRKNRGVPWLYDS